MERPLFSARVRPFFIDFALKAAYQEKVGHRIGTAQIYYVLKRHDWRKVKPRSRHPKKASPEAIETSKKLTPASMN
ncbi:MAG: winged helix-turn-helix domain-containing protein [Defluviitaleaceae bacterium]|nr:winged helix-turn-helix domain-containing protein [Defluviitaleaceae bacterium]